MAESYGSRKRIELVKYSSVAKNTCKTKKKLKQLFFKFLNL